MSITTIKKANKLNRLKHSIESENSLMKLSFKSCFYAAFVGGLASLVPMTADARSNDPCAGLKKWSLYVDASRSQAKREGEEETGAELAEDFARRLRELGDDAVNDFIMAEPPAGLGINLDRGSAAENSEALRTLIQEMADDPLETAFSEKVPEELQGFEGLSTRLLLKMLLLGEVEYLYGKIRSYVYLDEQKAGLMNVDMCLDRKAFLHWDIMVTNGGYDVFERSKDIGDFPHNPFPDLDMELPNKSTNPADSRSVWARDLDHKLHAQGKTGIEIRNIYYLESSTSELKRLDDDHRLYKVDNNSCIDLFTQGYPPATYGQLTDNDYCLGRCKHPAIINSGD